MKIIKFKKKIMRLAKKFEKDGDTLFLMFISNKEDKIVTTAFGLTIFDLNTLIHEFFKFILNMELKIEYPHLTYLHLDTIEKKLKTLKKTIEKRITEQIIGETEEEEDNGK